jgi:hypothetical protein
MHVVASPERRASILVSAAVFVILAGIGRVFLSPFPNGLLTQVGVEHLLVGGFIVALAAWEGYQFERIRPSELDGVPAVWELDEVETEEVRL